MDFKDFGFKKFINDGLEKKQITEPTPIQAEVIPYFKKHQNIVARAHTGSGKTFAFLLPILNNLDYQKTNEAQALILVPTRELARQIYQETVFFKEFNPNLSVGLFIGGEDNEKMKHDLSNKMPMIAIGTPQKVKELYDQNLLKYTTASWVVVDEFDMIFDLGFFDDLDYLIANVASTSVKALFSATFADNCQSFLKKYLPGAIIIDQVGKEVSKKAIDHVLIDTKSKDNKKVLEALVKAINPYIAIIFVNTKEEVSEVVSWLHEFGISSVGELHGDLQPRTRAAMLKKIKNNEFRYLVATDIAARGLDIKGVSHIISLDLPRDLNYYTHRAGRTAREDATGKSYVLFNLKNKDKINYLKHKGIEFSYAKLINNEIVFENGKLTEKRKPKKNFTSSEEKQIINRYKDKQVKPGYKKKRKQELDKVKKDIRRQHIKENIEKIKKDKYKKRQQSVFGKDE